jgi:hypothetical protein
MEELQDAIEDAQYMNAMYDDIPRPTKDWKWPSNEEMQVYMEKVTTTCPHLLAAEGLCKGSLGFYMVSINELPVISWLRLRANVNFLPHAQFMKYCKDQNRKCLNMAEFLEDVATFRVSLHFLFL